MRNRKPFPATPYNLTSSITASVTLPKTVQSRSKSCKTSKNTREEQEEEVQKPRTAREKPFSPDLMLLGVVWSLFEP